jgi:hypothetical protein
MLQQGTLENLERPQKESPGLNGRRRLELVLYTLPHTWQESTLQEAVQEKLQHQPTA